MYDESIGFYKEQGVRAQCINLDSLKGSTVDHVSINKGELTTTPIIPISVCYYQGYAML